MICEPIGPARPGDGSKNQEKKALARHRIQGRFQLSVDVSRPDDIHHDGRKLTVHSGSDLALLEAADLEFQDADTYLQVRVALRGYSGGQQENWAGVAQCSVDGCERVGSSRHAETRWTEVCS